MSEPLITAMYAAMKDTCLFHFPCIVVIEKVPYPLLSKGPGIIFDAHKPKDKIAVPPTRCLFRYRGCKPMSLEMADKCT